MSSKGILVTGGAGYIGSHVVRQLGEAGERVVTLDNLSRGFREAITYGPLIVGDTGDQHLVRRVLAEHGIGAVVHLAASTIVAESVAQPLKYYENNTSNTRSLLECCLEADVSQFVFSSAAAIYGMPPGGLASEDTPTLPISPYGSSKLASEWMLRDVSAVTKLRHVALRCFNVAGSDPGGRIGQSTRGATLLIKAAVEHAVGKRSHVSVYGTDYPTPDGTGVRDYIHVEDVASAHLAALGYLRSGGTSASVNCGYGHGYSVREVLAAVEQAAGRPLVVREEPRRAADPPILIANVDRIRSLLDWAPKFHHLDQIVGDALRWERLLRAQSAA